MKISQKMLFRSAVLLPELPFVYKRFINYRTQANCSLIITRLSSNRPNEPAKSGKSLTELNKDDAQITKSVGEKVKQASKDAYYTGIILVGVAVTGLMGYTIFRELFSSQSPNGIYSDALKICKADPKVMDVIGEPIKGYGETSSRGRRRRVSFVEFEQDGVKSMRLQFYIQGSRHKATVHVEVRKTKGSKYEYRYLFVHLDTNEVIILKDNRDIFKDATIA